MMDFLRSFSAKLLLCLAFFVLTVFAPALGEDAAGIVDTLELGEFQSAADEAESGVDVLNTILSLASGETKLDWQFIVSLTEDMKEELISRTGGVLAAFMLPVIMAALCRQAAGTNAKTAITICDMTCAALFLGLIAGEMSAARALLGNVAKVASAALPVLAALSAMAGAASASALLTPMADVMGTLIVDALGNWGVRLCAAACACACACAFSGSIKLDGVFSLIKSFVMWGSGVLLALFVGVLTVQGMLGAAYDSAAVKTAQYAFDKMIPVIGGDIADSMEAALSSVLLVKSAAGVTGLTVIVTSCAAPILRLWATLVAIRLSGAMTQSVCDKTMSDSIARFADAARMLLTICLVSVTLALILTGAAINAGNGIR